MTKKDALNKDELEVVDALRALKIASDAISKFEKTPQMMEYRKALLASIEARDIIDGIVGQYMQDDNQNDW